MNIIQQIGSMTLLGLRSLPLRAGGALVVVIGIAGVVAVLVSILAMAIGMTESTENAGRDDRAIILRNGSASEYSSVLPRDSVQIITSAPGIAHDVEGKPILSAEPLRMVSLRRRSDDAELNVTVRGVGPLAEALRPEVKLEEGRMFRTGLNELIVGRTAKAQFRDLDVGSKIQMNTSTWTVVGTFSRNGDFHESELMADAAALMLAERGEFNSVTVALNSPTSVRELTDALRSNPALSVDVVSENTYLSKQSESVSSLAITLGYFVGGIMAAGAMFAALNNMYAAVSMRAREIATLRALGFNASAVVTSVLIEALLLALIGGFIGAFIAWYFFNGYMASTSGGPAEGQLIFRLAVTAQLSVLGLAWACAIGLLGGLFPAVKAARMPVAAALREV